jgi:hypothetical protein
MAVGASAASAAAGTKLNLKGTVSNLNIFSGGHATQCENITFTGQVTEGATASAPANGTISSVVSKGCVEHFWNQPMTVSLKTPWTVSIVNGRTTVSNINLLVSMTGYSEVCSWTLTRPTLVTLKGAWNVGSELTAKPLYNACAAMDMATAGPASIVPGTFAVTYTQAP